MKCMLLNYYRPIQWQRTRVDKPTITEKTSDSDINQPTVSKDHNHEKGWTLKDNNLKKGEVKHITRSGPLGTGQNYVHQQVTVPAK